MRQINPGVPCDAMTIGLAGGGYRTILPFVGACLYGLRRYVRPILAAHMLFVSPMRV